MGSYKGFLFLCSASVLIYRIEVVKKTIILFRLYEIAKGRKVITKLFSCQQRNKYLVKSMKNKSEIFKKIREYLGLSQKAMGKSWDVPLRKSDGARNRIDRLESELQSKKKDPDSRDYWDPGIRDGEDIILRTEKGCL